MRCAIGLLPFLLASTLAGPVAAQPAADGASDAPTAASPARPGPGWRGGAPSPQMLTARRTVRAQCAADVARLCPEAAEAPALGAQAGGEAGATPGEAAGRHGGRRWGAMRCLRERRSEVTPPCAQALDAMSAARAAAGSGGGAPPATPPPG